MRDGLILMVDANSSRWTDGDKMMDNKWICVLGWWQCGCFGKSVSRLIRVVG